MNKVYYIGLDVHKDSIAIAYTNSESRAEAIFYGTCGGGITTAERKLRKLAKNWKSPEQENFGILCRGIRLECTSLFCLLVI